MSDGRTNWTRADAREAWSKSGLTYADLTPASMERLRALLDAEMQSGEYLRSTFRASHKPKPQREGGYDIRCTAWYFKGRNARQCITFEPGGFVGFAGWADDTNLQPVIRGFLSWLGEMSKADRKAA